MSRFVLAAFLTIFLLAILPSSYALLTDCDVETISFFRAYTSPLAPVVQVNAINPANSNLLGFPLGFSPFYVGSEAQTTYVPTNNVFTPLPVNTVPTNRAINPTNGQTTLSNSPTYALTNGYIFVNISIGQASTAPYYPNVTLTFNGQQVQNCLTGGGSTSINTAITGGPCTNAQGDVISVTSTGNILIAINGVQQCANNSLYVNGSSFVTTSGAQAGTSTCGRLYVFNISTICSNTSSLVGDPQFLGLRGQAFQVHGIDGAVYNIISDKSYNVNSRFSFLNGPRVCPIMPSTGKKSPSCWSHPGSYLGEVGVVTSSGDKLFVRAGAASTGFASVTLNDVPLALNTPVSLSYANKAETSEIRLISSHEMIITAGSFVIELENIDSFLNLRSVSVTGSIGKLQSHGLLGQTWQNKRYPSTLKVIEGEVDDYVITDDDIFGTEFIYNLFETASE